MNNRKKLKNIIHRFKLENQSKEKEGESATSENNPDENLNFYSARFQEVKQDNLTHELNRIRRMAIKESLNRYEHAFSNHDQLEPYQRTGEWLDWIGIVADISMPTGKQGQMDGKVLIDKFSYENVNEQKELLDYHIWLPVNEIRYLLSTDKQTIAIGDLIRGKSKVVQYSSRGKKHGVKYGLGATLIKGAGIYVSFQKVNYKHVAIGRQLQSNYDRQNDWVLKLTNDVPKDIIARYGENKDIDIFIPKTHGHVLAKYQPSQYTHYFDRLQNLPEENEKKCDDKRQEYTATIKSFDVKNFDKEVLPVIHLTTIRNENNRIVSAGGWYQFNSELAKLGELKANDKLQFVASPEYFANHTEKQTLASPKLISSDKDNRAVLPTDLSLLCGWILSNKSLKNQSYKSQDMINKYLYWKEKPKTKDDKDKISIGISIESLADKVQVPGEKIKTFISQKGIKPAFSINGTDYYIDDFTDELRDYVKTGNERIKNALQKAVHTKQEFSIHNPKEVAKTQRGENDTKTATNKSINSKKVAPKIIKKAFIIEIDTTQGIYTTNQFDSLKQANKHINQLCRQSDLNAFINVTDKEGNEVFVSVKEIQAFRTNY